MLRPSLLRATVVTSAPRAAVLVRPAVSVPATRALSTSVVDLAAPRKKRTTKKKEEEGTKEPPTKKSTSTPSATAAASAAPKKATNPAAAAAAAEPKSTAAKSAAAAASKPAAAPASPTPSDPSDPSDPSAPAATPAAPASEAPATPASPEPKLPRANAPSSEKASTLSDASRAHKDLAIDPDVVVAPNVKSATTIARETIRSNTAMHVPRHAGENPPGVPPQALKRAPETFNIRIPFPSDQQQQQQQKNVWIPTLYDAGNVGENGGGLKKAPPAVHAVADEERVHSPVISALQTDAHQGVVSGVVGNWVAQAGIPVVTSSVQRVQGYAHCAKNLLGAFVPSWMGEQPVEYTPSIKFNPGRIPRPLSADERRGLWVLGGVLLVLLAPLPSSLALNNKQKEEHKSASAQSAAPAPASS